MKNAVIAIRTFNEGFRYTSKRDNEGWSQVEAKQSTLPNIHMFHYTK